AVLDRAPRQHGDRGRLRETELDVVAGVVPAAGEVEADVLPVVEGGVAPPGDPVPLWLRAGDLGLVEPDRLLQGLTVVVVVVRGRGGQQDRGQAGGGEGGGRDDREQDPGGPGNTYSHGSASIYGQR